MREFENRETASLIKAYLRIVPERRRAVFRLIQSMIKGPPG
jgi:hypothetical protein